MDSSALKLRSQYIPISPLGRKPCGAVAQLAAIFLALIVALPASAIDWDGNGGDPPDGTYGVAANWNPDQVPSTDDTATFNANDSYTVTFDTEPDAIGQLDVSAGSITFKSSGGARTLAVNSAGGSQDVTVGGDVSLTLGILDNPLHLTVGGELTVEDNATISVYGSQLTANGDVLIDGGSLSLSGSLMQPIGTFNLAASKSMTMQNGGSFTSNPNYTTASNANYEVTGEGSSMSASGFSIVNGAIVNVKDKGSLQTSSSSISIGNFSSSVGTLAADGIGTMVTSSGGGGNWGQSGGQAFVTFSNGAEGTFGNLNLAMGSAVGTSAMVDVLSGAELNTGRLFIAASGGTSTSGTLNIQGAGSSVTQGGAITTLIGHASTGTAVVNIGTTESGAIFTHTGGGITVNATGTVSIGSATTTGTFDVDGALTVNGTINLAGGTMFARDTLTINSGSNFNFTGGTLHATNIVGTLENNGGTLEPGFSIATLTIDGDYTQSADSNLLIELGSDVDFDQVQLTETATLDGTLQLNLIDLGGGLFEPESDDVFEILSALEINSEFSNVADGMRLTTLGGEGSFVVTYDTDLGTVTLSDYLVASPTLPGDYNGDGKVSAADYTVWRDTLGSTTDLRANGDDSNSVIDEDDYQVWLDNYGMPNGNGAGAYLAPGDSPGANYAVPEPGTLVLVVLAGVVWARSAARRG